METIEEHNARNKAYYDANKANILAHKAAHYDQINATRRARTGAKTKAQYLADCAVKRKPPLHYKNKRKVYSVVAAVMKNLNSKRHHKWLGCSPVHFKQHIESQWRPGWSWENYGTAWECDHIRAVILFDFTDEEQLKAAAHYTNVRPLTPKENRERCLLEKIS